MRSRRSHRKSHDCNVLQSYPSSVLVLYRRSRERARGSAIEIRDEMSLDGFLTFLTIVIAAYAVMPAVTRLRIALKKTWLAFLTLIGLVLVLYFEFFALVGLPCSSSLGSWCERLRFRANGPISPQHAAFVVVGLWLIATGITLARTKLGSRSLPTLSRLVSELTYQQKFAELVDLVEPQLRLLTNAAMRRTRMARLHDKVAALDPSRISGFKKFARVQTGAPLAARNSLGVRASQQFCRYVSRLAPLVPTEKRREKAAQDIFRVLFKDPSLILFVSVYRPEFGVRLLSSDAWGAKDFSGSFLTRLISAKDSLLYKELAANQNLAECGYAFPSHNKLLHFLFADADTAKRLGVWKPIGDYMLATLTHSSEYVASLNRTADGFHENEMWRDPVFVGLAFFDLMVTAAACQGVRWHMWLYYYPNILECIIKIYDASGEDVDEHDEWPTRASYLIYVLFQGLLDWIGIIRCVPEDSPHRTMRNDSPTHENDNIPKSAAIALGSCLGRLLRPNKVGPRFRRYIYDMVLEKIRDFPQEGPEGQLRRVMVTSIVQRGPLGIDEIHGQELKRLWQKTDPAVCLDLPDYETLLVQTYGQQK